MKELRKKVEVGKDHIVSFVVPDFEEGQLVELIIKSVEESNEIPSRQQHLETVKKGCENVSINDPLQWQREERKDRGIL